MRKAFVTQKGTKPTGIAGDRSQRLVVDSRRGTRDQVRVSIQKTRRLEACLIIPYSESRFQAAGYPNRLKAEFRCPGWSVQTLFQTGPWEEPDCPLCRGRCPFRLSLPPCFRLRSGACPRTHHLPSPPPPASARCMAIPFGTPRHRRCRMPASRPWDSTGDISRSMSAPRNWRSL